MKQHKPIKTLAILSLFNIQAATTNAEVIGGIDFSMGASSFADAVITYNPLFGGGPAPTEPAAIDPISALGIPDFPAGGTVGDTGAVSLGNGGLISLRFVNNLLTNSGTSDRDLQIFEVGPSVEETFVAIRPPAGDNPHLGKPCSVRRERRWILRNRKGLRSDIINRYRCVLPRFSIWRPPL